MHTNSLAQPIIFMVCITAVTNIGLRYYCSEDLSGIIVAASIIALVLGGVLIYMMVIAVIHTLSPYSTCNGATQIACWPT